MPPVILSDLVLAFDFVSSSAPFERSAYICRDSGEIFWESDLIGDGEELPEDLGDPEHYIKIPHKNDLDLGKKLVLRFVSSEFPDSYDEVERIFRRKGAYSQYKTFLESRGLLEKWYKFEEAETDAALRQWAKDEELELYEERDG